MDGFTVGILMQEPQPRRVQVQSWRTSKTGLPRPKAMVDQLQPDLQPSLAEPDADYDALLAEMGKLQEAIDHQNCLGP